MTKLSELFPAFSGAIKSQKFTANGTFTPSAALLARGGWVRVVVVGAGGAGSAGSINGPDGLGGARALPAEFWLKLTGPTTITIGASSGIDGGATSFSSAVSQGGRGAIIAKTDNNRASSGEHGYGAGPSAGNGGGSNSGRGGVGYGAGGGGGGQHGSPPERGGGLGAPGYCEVFWEE